MWLRCFSTTVVLLLFVLDGINSQSRTCVTPNQERAQCISIYNCQLLYDAVNTNDPEQLRFLKKSQCGTSGRTPLVCCGRYDNYQDSSSENVPSRRPIEVRNNNALPTRETCGIQSSDRILNGVDAGLEEFPWMALLEYENSNGKRRFACGGTLIASRYVLTASHCMRGQVLKSVGRLVNIRLGEWNIDTEQDCVGSGKYRSCSSRPIDVGIEESTSHPDYSDNNQNRYHDIALIRLNREVPFSKYIKPICLPGPNEASSPGTNLMVVGWGRTESASRSAIKQKLQVPLAASNQCRNTFSSAQIQLRNSQICAGGVKGRDSCTGDSGGPLMTTTQNDTSQWYIEGIVSFGAQCGTEGWPGVYTKVTSYLDWIRSTVY